MARHRECDDWLDGAPFDGSSGLLDTHRGCDECLVVAQSDESCGLESWTPKKW